MMGFRDLINKLLGKDPIYSNVKQGQELDYQACFLLIINSIDIHNLSNRDHGRSFNQELAEKDLKAIDDFALQAKSKVGLSPVLFKLWSSNISGLTHGKENRIRIGGSIKL